MITVIKRALGLKKAPRKMVQLPEGLQRLEVIPAKRWWN